MSTDMAELYTVFERRVDAGKQIWAVSDSGEKRATVSINELGAIVRKTVSNSMMPGEVAKRARAGYKLVEQNAFFNEDLGVFSKTHPDFVMNDKISSHVLFARPTSLDDAILQVDAMMGTPAVMRLIDASERRAWIRRQEQKGTYLVAGDTHPLWSLLIAELAIKQGWELTSARNGCPDKRPSDAPIEWERWLSGFFAASSINQAQLALGWTMAKVMNKNAAEMKLDSSNPANFL